MSWPRRIACKVVHRAGKLGLGTAVVAGFGVASADIVGVMDADFSHPPALVPRMHAVFRATEADVLVASRYVPGGSTPNWPCIAEDHVARARACGAAALADSRRRVGLLSDQAIDCHAA